MKPIFWLQMRTTKLKLNDLTQFSQILVIYKTNLPYNFFGKKPTKLLLWAAVSSFLAHKYFNIGWWYIRDHPYITSAKYWVGGSRKWPVLLTFSTIFMLI